jgi:hypothetical protein
VVVVLVILTLSTVHAQSQCLYEYYGKAGDTLYIGEDSDRPRPDEPPPYVQWVDVIERDSTDEDGGRYWWFKNASPGTFYHQLVDGSVEYVESYRRARYRYGMCDVPGYIRRDEAAMEFLGYDVIYLFRKPAWAMRYARYYIDGDSLIYGVRYGCAATTTSVDDEQLGPTSLRVEGSSIHIGGEIPPGSVVQVFDLHGRLQRQVQVNPYDAIHLDDLPRGVYFATVVDARGASPRLPLRIVIR